MVFLGILIPVNFTILHLLVLFVYFLLKHSKQWDKYQDKQTGNREAHDRI